MTNKPPTAAIPPIERCVITLPGSEVTMSFCKIRSGSFRMGSRGNFPDEEPPHVVQIWNDFWLGQFPVTQEQFGVWASTKRIIHSNGFPNQPRNPAEQIPWTLAIRFCAWLTEVATTQFPEGHTLACLPTEAEWEYACRAGTETEYYTGNGESALQKAGWYEGNSDNSTHPVGENGPNAWGLYDMHGNVWEWCHDLWDEEPYRRRIDGITDPEYEVRVEEYSRTLSSILKRKDSRVVRGGSWYCPARDCRSACRFTLWPGDRVGDFGFRVCLVPSLAIGGAVRRDSETAEGRSSREGPKTKSETRPDLDTAGFSKPKRSRKKDSK